MAAVLPAMIARRSGRIINIGGTYGMRGRAGRAAYSAAKWGLRGLTKSTALEAGPFNITATASRRGWSKARASMRRRQMRRGARQCFDGRGEDPYGGGLRAASNFNAEGCCAGGCVPCRSRWEADDGQDLVVDGVGFTGGHGSIRATCVLVQSLDHEQSCFSNFVFANLADVPNVDDSSALLILKNPLISHTGPKTSVKRGCCSSMSEKRCIRGASQSCDLFCIRS